MKRAFFIVSIILLTHNLQGQISVTSGKVERLENFPSQYVEARNIDIWIPKDYEVTKKYSVLYMHDGQMLFDSTGTWNHQEWGVDEHLSKLINDSVCKPTIVVGIWNSGVNRHADYFPQAPFETLDVSYQDLLYQVKRGEEHKLFASKVHSDNYLKFIVEELKPYIDTHYSTLTDQENTAIMGSSMGGLISLYAICEYPQVFGSAACLSTHWPGTFDPNDEQIPNAFFQYLTYYLPCSLDHKIYFDYGTETIDTWYEPHQKKVDELMENAGFIEGKNWVTQKFEGAEHSENAWNVRLDSPLMFLVKK